MGVTVTAEIPERVSKRMEHLPDPCVMVIFGASGDLTRRKLMPALYRVFAEHLLPQGFSVVGFARTEMTDEQFRESMRDAVHEFAGDVDAEIWKKFEQGLFYLPAHVTNPADFPRLNELLARIDRDRGTGGNRIFYLAVPPSSVSGIVDHLHSSGMARTPKAWTRIIIEKPFGTDLESARTLNAELSRVFDEDQIYRIDHYLGKETVQNLIVFRFANGIFEPIWNRRYVSHVQITAAESVGVENRAGYYEESGALRDMVQNHMLQVLSLVGMEPPVAWAGDSVREEKTKVLRAIRPIPLDRLGEFVVRAQYGPGIVNGVKVPGYRSEPGVSPQSRTDTFVAMKLLIENWRWAGVPFYIRTGKRLPRRVTEIAIAFRQPPLLLFEGPSAAQIQPNLLAIRIQPDEGISLKFAAKRPGPSMYITDVNMDFKYSTTFGTQTADAYQRLLLDCMLGDATLFARRDAVEISWALVTPLLQAWAQDHVSPIPTYEAGSWGPIEADRLIAAECCGWREP